MKRKYALEEILPTVYGRRYFSLQELKHEAVMCRTRGDLERRAIELAVAEFGYSLELRKVRLVIVLKRYRQHGWRSRSSHFLRALQLAKRWDF